MTYTVFRNTEKEAKQLKQLAYSLEAVLDPIFAKDMRFSEREPFLTAAFECTDAFLKQMERPSSLSNEVRTFELKLITLIQAYIEIQALLDKLSFSLIRLKMVADQAENCAVSCYSCGKD